jgi:tRNA-dihydrouridine synthase
MHLVPEQDIVRIGDLANELLPKALHIDGGEACVVHLRRMAQRYLGYVSSRCRTYALADDSRNLLSLLVNGTMQDSAAEA